MATSRLEKLPSAAKSQFMSSTLTGADCETLRLDMFDRDCKPVGRMRIDAPPQI